MTDKYSLAKCEQYGRRLATHLCNQYFAAGGATSLDGPGILGFTPVRQINLLVVRQLLHQWQADVSRLRSPYFDFEAPAVQSALTEFQNVLSRYIKVNREAFEPMLTLAITWTLQLATNPAPAYQKLFFEPETETTVAELREGLRYLDINKEFVTAFLNTLPVGNTLVAEHLGAQLTAYQSSNYRAQQPVQHLVGALSHMLPLTEADLREDGPVASTSAGTVLPSAPEAPTAVQEEIKQPVSSPMTVTPSISVNVAGTVAEIPSSADVPLHEKLKATQPTAVPLATALRAAQPQPSALAERNPPKVDTLREAISINQRFSFINELFNGENMEYHAAIQHLDAQTDLEQARTYITQQLAQRYDWSRKEEHMSKLIKLVERKFASIAA